MNAMRMRARPWADPLGRGITSLVLLGVAWTATACMPMCDYCESYTIFEVVTEIGIHPKAYHGLITVGAEETEILCPRNPGESSAPFHGKYHCSQGILRLWLLGEAATVALTTDDGDFSYSGSVSIGVDKASATCACDKGAAVIHLGATVDTTEATTQGD